MRVLVGETDCYNWITSHWLSGWSTLRADSFSISRWIVGSGSHAGIYPTNHKHRAEIVSALGEVEGLRVFTRSNILGSLHYSDSRNSPPILVLADPLTILLSNPTYLQRPSQGQCWDSHRAQQARRRFPPDMDSNRLMEQTRMGLAGYSPYEEDMRGIFLAQGPGSQQCSQDLFPLPVICFCLSIN